jgi:hypothetical protein
MQCNTAYLTENMVFWDAQPYSAADRYQCFEEKTSSIFRENDWRFAQRVSPKRWYLSARLHGVTTHDTATLKYSIWKLKSLIANTWPISIFEKKNRSPRDFPTPVSQSLLALSPPKLHIRPTVQSYENRSSLCSVAHPCYFIFYPKRNVIAYHSDEMSGKSG